MATVEANGTSLFYSVHGQGPACLIMHGGLGLDYTSYRSLDPLGENARLVYYDHRGNGRSGRPPIETLTMEQLADDAAALASHLGADQIVVFGHSYGGFIAQEFALRHPSRVSSLILCCTVPGQLGTGETEAESTGPPPPQEFIDLISNPPTSDGEYGEKMSGVIPYFFRRYDPNEVRREFADTIYSAAAMNRGFEILSNWSSVDRLNTIEAPTLILAGSHDIFTSPSQSHRIARRVPHAEFVEFSESGHVPWIDEPEKFFQVMSDWLKR